MTKQEAFSNLEVAMAAKKSLEEQMAKAAEVEAICREEVAKIMEAEGIRTQKSPNDKFLYLSSERTTLELVDEGVVRDYLQTQGRLAEYLKLDITKAKASAKKEGIPGFTEKVTTVFSVREVPKEVEKVEQEETPAEFAKRVRGEA